MIFYLLVLGEHEYASGPDRMFYLLVLGEHGYSSGPERIFYLLAVDEMGYNLKRGQKRVTEEQILLETFLVLFAAAPSFNYCTAQ
jgi:hypothetical protein